MGHKVRLLSVFFAVSVGLGTTPTTPVAAQTPPPRLASHHELQPPNPVLLHRDAGYSVPLTGSLAGGSLWLFGDTGITDPALKPLFFAPGTWGAVAPSTPGVVPKVSEIPPAGTPIDLTPNPRGISAILPQPTGLLWPDGQTPCPGDRGDHYSYVAAWPMGATAGPAGEMTLFTDGSSTPLVVRQGSGLVFIAVPEVCVQVPDNEDVPLTPPRGFEALDDRVWSHYPDMVIQRQKIVAYSPGCSTVNGQQVCNRVVASKTLFQTTNGTALPWKRFLLNPVFWNGHLYFNAHKCDTWAETFGACTAGRLTSVRAPVTSLHQPSTYQWYQAGGTWGAEATAATMLPAGANGGAILTDMHNFPGKDFLLMQQWHFGGGYQLWRGQTPAGPWTLAKQDTMPGCESGPEHGCYALVGHPELSTPTNLVYTFFDRDDGYVRFSSVGNIP